MEAAAEAGAGGVEPRARAQPAEDTEEEDGLAEEEGLPNLDPGLDDLSEPDVFSEVDETPFTEAMSHHALQGSLEEQEEGRALGEDPLSEVDSCSMATAPQTVVSSSESCPITMTTAVVSILKAHVRGVSNHTSPLKTFH